MVEIQIKQAHINQGLRESFTLDAIAMAIKEAVESKFNLKKRSFQVIIPSRDIGFIDGYRFELPLVVQEFIRSSDKGDRLQPCVFQLDIPDELFERK